MSPVQEIRFYFDYVSPYAYLAWRDLQMRGARVRAIPVVFGALLKANGQLGPAEIPAKRKFLVRDCIRRADELGVGFTFPPRHPFRSLEALRASIDQPAELIDRMFRACWEEGRDLSDRAVLEDIVGRALPADSGQKEALQQLTSDAIARGVFGVPTCEVAGELIWGSDRLRDVLALAEGKGTLSEERLAQIGERGIGVVRARGVDPAVRKRVEEIFSKAAFMRWLGAKIESVEPGRLVTTLQVRPDHGQQDELVHAGVLTTLADHSAGAAAASLMDDTSRPLTIELKINLLRPASGPVLRCHSTVLRAGKNVTVAESEVFDGAKLVAKATVTLAVVAIHGPK